MSCLVLRDNFLIDGESRNICWEFFADLLADMLPIVAAEAKGYPVVSLEQMDLNNRYPPAGSLFHSVRGQPNSYLVLNLVRAGACPYILCVVLLRSLLCLCPREIGSALKPPLFSLLTSSGDIYHWLSFGDQPTRPALFFSGRSTFAGHQPIYICISAHFR